MARRHAGVLQRIEGVQVIGHWTPNDKIRPAELGPRAGSRQELINRSDVLFICTVPNQTVDATRAVVVAGKNFHVEKPLGTRLSGPSDIAQSVQESQLVTSVGYQWRANPVIREAKNMLNGVDVTEVTARYLDPALGYVDEWFVHSSQSGGPVVEQGAHVIDMARHMFGEFEVVGATEAYDIPQQYLDQRPFLHSADIPTSVVAKLQFARGTPGRFESSVKVLEPNDRKVEIEVACADGSVLTVARDRITRDEEVVYQLPVPPGSNFTTISTLEQDLAFFHADKVGDPALVYCDYPDALETHRKAIDIVRLAQAA